MSSSQTPKRVEHTVHLLPPGTTLDEQHKIVLALYDTRSSFTYSADAAHALVHAGNENSKVVVWSGERWSADIFAWLEARGIAYTTRQIDTSSTGSDGRSEFSFSHWPTEHKVITQAYNVRSGYYNRINPGLTGHEGLDIMAPMGSNIYAVAAGTVEMTRQLDNQGHPYGIAVYLQHEAGYRTAYAHLRSIEPAIKAGKRVQGGQLLGKADSTGNVWPKDDPEVASHLHLTLYHDGATNSGETEMQYDIIDPSPFINHLMPEGWKLPTGQLVTGWGYMPGLEIRGELAKVISPSYINLRATADTTRSPIGQVYNGVVVVITGAARNNYLPIKVAQTDVK